MTTYRADLTATPEPPFDPEQELLDILDAYAVHALTGTSLSLHPVRDTDLADRLMAWRERAS